MDSCTPHQDECIRKIEDIIDIQKAKGRFNVRQVAFNLPMDTGCTVPSNFAKSLECCLSNTKSVKSKKSLKKIKARNQEKFLPDVISWPSDSDITVLRLKLELPSDLIENVANTTPGDGLHQPDSSSMVNLATLIIQQTQHPSKQCVDMEEFLLPLSSWEQEHNQHLGIKEALVEEQPCDISTYAAVCSHRDFNIGSPDSAIFSTKRNRKSKVARFLRLYFCPCCTCLYNLERMREEPSICFIKRKDCEETIV